MIAEVRANLKTSLEGLGCPVHSSPVGAPGAPSAVIMYGSPYVNPTGWQSSTVALDVRISVPATSTPQAVPNLDTLIDKALELFAAAGINWGTIPPPAVDTEQGVLFVDIPTETVWKDD